MTFASISYGIQRSAFDIWNPAKEIQMINVGRKFRTQWPFGSKLFLRPRFLSCVFLFFFFFFLVQPQQLTLSTVNSASVHCSRIPQITLFSHFFIKNGSHSTIYTFKNYFATVFSVSVKISSIQTHPFTSVDVKEVSIGF